MMTEFPDFYKILEVWFSRCGRHELPWRKTSDPYRIWISEIILQQTRIAQGTDYYLRFTERFPDVFSLAEAEEDEVLKLWQGLGYYSRARNLHAAARTVASAGVFPDTYEGIRALKGIGDYTAAAISSFAFRLPHPVVDGNVYRVLSRIFGIGTPIDTVAGKKEFAALAERLLDRERPDIYNSAIMDFGAIQCTPQSPDCSRCPFAEHCRAKRENTVDTLPVKSKKTAVKDRHFVYFYLEDAESLLLRRRPAGDIWQGLYEPLLIEYASAPSDASVRGDLLSLLAEENCHPDPASVQPVVRDLKHLLSHQRLHIDGYRLSLESLPDLKGHVRVPKASRDAYAVPKVVSSLFEAVDQGSSLLF